MVTHHVITFPLYRRPNMATVIREVERLSGLSIHYRAEILSLHCPALHLSVALLEADGIGEPYGYQITTFVQEADYLMVTTIMALLRLGGSFEASLPTWAGQPWQQVSKWKYRLRRNRIIYSD